MATAPSWQEQQLPLQQRQRHLRIDGNDASLTTINKGNAIVMRAAMPAWGRQQNKAITTKETVPSWTKGDNAVVMRATTPSQQWLKCLCIDNSNNAIVMRATLAIMTMAKMPAHQWQ
jgi:hypothetical protein